MKSILKTSLISITLISFASCNQNENQSVNQESADTETQKATEVIQEPKSSNPGNVDSLVSVINAKRSEIESNLGEPVSIETTNLKAKIKQKWSKIHFYSNGNQIVRIKTYPYDNISKRTEEFYLDNEELILAVIEDDGSGEKGKTVDQIDKMYFFYEGTLIKELSNANEKEYSIKNSEAEELAQEVKEYLDIYYNQLPK